jgi:hypothetical protein
VKFSLALFNRVIDRIQQELKPTMEAIKLEGFSLSGFYSAVSRNDGDGREFSEALKTAQIKRDRILNQGLLEKAEAELAVRGISGFEEPVFWQGELVATKRKYSDTCLIFLLKALAPDKYREAAQVENHINVGGSQPLPTAAERKAMEADLARYVRGLAAKAAQDPAFPGRS